MYKIAIVLSACVAAAACTPTTTGTVAGATTGAIVGGPVGAVVGGGIGAVAGSASTPRLANNTRIVRAGPGTCYLYDQSGNPIPDTNGRPMVHSC